MAFFPRATARQRAAEARHLAAIVQGPDASCALHAAGLALWHTAPSQLQHMVWRNPAGATQVRLHPPGQATSATGAARWLPAPTLPEGGPGAAWWQAVRGAVHGWQGLAGAPKLQCDTYLQLLAGAPAYRHLCDVDNLAYLLAMHLHGPATQALGLCGAQAQAWRSFVASTPQLQARLQAQVHWQTRLKAPALAQLLQRWGLADAQLRAQVVQGVQAQADALARGRLPLFAHLLAAQLAEKLAAGRAVCCATRPRLPARLAPHRLTRMSDALMHWRQPGYPAPATDGARAGLLAQHAYALLGVRRRYGRVALQLVEPLGRVGQRSVGLGAWQVPLAARRRIFWLDLAQALPALIALYVTAEPQHSATPTRRSS